MRESSGPVTRLVTVLLLLFGFLVGVKALGEGFKLLGGGAIELIFATTENPFISLVVGILATTVVQSSSVTTAMIVGLVAAPESPLPLANAVPISPARRRRPVRLPVVRRCPRRRHRGAFARLA